MLTQDKIEQYLNRKSEPTIYLDSVPSTNLFAAQLAKDGTPDGTVVIADSQTNGLGRLGREFYSPPGVGIYMSYVKRIPADTENLGLLASIVALAVCDAITVCCGIPPKIKWPNDVLINGKKVCGVLTKLITDTATNKMTHAIIGIGVNVNQQDGDFPEEILHKAGSIRAAYGKRVQRAPLCAEIINNLDRLLLKEDALSVPATPYVKIIRSMSCTIGQKITITCNAGSEPAKALDIAPDGGLVVETAAGVKVIRSGEIEEFGEWSLVSTY
jgi:BirA family transcriptional regulator, biotin operon repressor / biotin---[acetyl-CoA-carboxylase] ligase